MLKGRRVRVEWHCSKVGMEWNGRWVDIVGDMRTLGKGPSIGICEG